MMIITSLNLKQSSPADVSYQRRSEDAPAPAPSDIEAATVLDTDRAVFLIGLVFIIA